MSQSRVYLGGSFAPEITEDLLSQYSSLIQETNSKTIIGDCLRKLLKPVLTWWELPESTGPTSGLHQSGRGILQPLDEAIQKELWEDLPWDEELKVIQEAIEQITSKDLRNAAFHLLWYVKELNLDREPLTLQRVSST